MSVLIIGSTALDSIRTPHSENPRLLGGSASHAAVAASFFTPVRLVGVVGDDFPKRYMNLYQRHGIDLAGLQILPGKTFHWSGEYELNMDNRRTLLTELGVFETFTPTLPKTHQSSPYVLLANIAPSLQSHVLDQMRRPKFVVADTMDLWLNIALHDVLALLKRVDAFVLNESEAHQLTERYNMLHAAREIHKLGPRYVIIKKGHNGAMLSGPSGVFLAPAYPLDCVVDPTGAGDSFVGGMMGYLAATGGPVEKKIRRATIYGSVVASFCCEGFGLTRITRVKRRDIDRRVRELERLVRW
ncbi:MAG: PfkB family carbohydrate kinase [Verrucomicrobia subdivision 3 bacterium]|nr:PfkB family carbohydrate kinase [Limisphaerales bacterium]